MREDKNIVCKAEIHWVIIIPYIILIAIGTYLGGKYGFLITLIISLFLGFAKKLIAMLTTELYFTNKLIYGKVGFINTKDLASPFDKIDHVSVESGLGGKLLGYGTIVVHSISGKYNFQFISHPEHFRDVLLDTIERYKASR
ncbi:MAG: PH domain-containing protein [Spirochaetaceae bacterium]|nr:PH domain-containing protein [Spirochaetaceae bacterium]